MSYIFTKMVTKQYQKSKGNQFEYKVEYNFKRITEGEVKLLEKRGFAREFDIEILIPPYKKIAVECKFHKTMTWNEMKRIWDKLKKSTPSHTSHYLVFKTNQQPVLVYDGCHCQEWVHLFGSLWVDKHD